MTTEDTADKSIDICMEVPDGSVVLRAVEIVQFLSPDGIEVVAARWQGNGNVVAELGMVEYAKQELVISRFGLTEDHTRED